MSRRINGPLIDRLSAKFDRSGGCWLWRAALNEGGYGVIGVGGAGRLAHRVAYQLLIGPIPKGKVLDHLCRNRACVNPSHLEPVTDETNRQRGGNYIKTHCKNGHPFNEKNTINNHGNRGCRTCQLEAQRRSYHKNKGRR